MAPDKYQTASVHLDQCWVRRCSSLLWRIRCRQTICPRTKSNHVRRRCV